MPVTGITPNGTAVTRVTPSAPSAGAASKVTPISVSLTPSAGSVSIADGLVVNGMLNGWRVSDLTNAIDSLADDGAAFELDIHRGHVSTVGWLTDNPGFAPENEPYLYYPSPLMGDFTLEVKFTAASGDPYRTVFVGGVAFPTSGLSDTPDFTHYWGCNFGRVGGTSGKPRAGFTTNNGTQKYDGGDQNWDQNHWLKLQRAGDTITASHKYGSASYADIASDKFGLGGGATNVGIGFSTNAADGAEDTFEIFQVDLTGFEWTDDP